MLNDAFADEVRNGRLVILVLCVSLWVPLLAAQRRAPGAPSGSGAGVPLTITLKVGAEAYRLTGHGKCHHAPRAAIYGVAAEQWSVQHSEGARSVSLTMWRPKGAANDMMTLAVNTGTKSFAVNTVKAGNSGPPSGSGTITLTPADKGGTFTIDAAAADGTRLAGTLSCGAFTAPVPEGGD